jgi:hypothetical protein
MILRSEQILDTQAGRVACFQFGVKNESSVVSILFDGRTLTLRYDGDEKFAKEI